ncbi:MAG: acyl carrier protein [Clostridia bacterium]|nr:acyl carrier protein [Clostridia bacterium]
MSFEKVKKLLSEQLNIAPESVDLKSRVIEDLGADSLDVVEMLMVLEDEFNITVTDEESVELKTVGDIVKLIDSKAKKDK